MSLSPPPSPLPCSLLSLFLSPRTLLQASILLRKANNYTMVTSQKIARGFVLLGLIQLPRTIAQHVTNQHDLVDLTVSASAIQPGTQDSSIMPVPYTTRQQTPDFTIIPVPYPTKTAISSAAGEPSYGPQCVEPRAFYIICGSSLLLGFIAAICVLAF